MPVWIKVRVKNQGVTLGYVVMDAYGNEFLYDADRLSYFVFSGQLILRNAHVEKNRGVVANAGCTISVIDAADMKVTPRFGVQ